MPKPALKLRDLARLYSELADLIPDSTRPVQHVARLSRRPLGSVLALAQQLGIPINGEETIISAKDAAAIVWTMIHDEPSDP